MRRASTYLALLGLALLGTTATAATASAAPAVTLKAVAVPIPGFKETGNILGAGTAVKFDYTIKGTEYGGFPPPLIGVNVYLPLGAVLHPQGFVTCPPTTIEQIGPQKCPKASSAGPKGRAFGVVSFGTERVHEELEILPFFAPGGGLEFYSAGHTPTSIELLSKGNFQGSAPGFSKKFVATVPLVETVPGAPDGSTETISVVTGAARKEHGKTIYYSTVPTKCPKGGFKFKSELLFAGLGGLEPQTTTTEYSAPCPTRKVKKH
jgi:hypothetical protein